MHLQAGMRYEDRIFITVPPENPSTSQSPHPTVQGSWEQGTVWMMLSMDESMDTLRIPLTLQSEVLKVCK